MGQRVVLRRRLPDGRLTDLGARVEICTEPAATGTQTITGLAAQPDALLVFGSESTAANTQVEAYITFNEDVFGEDGRHLPERGIEEGRESQQQ